MTELHVSDEGLAALEQQLETAAGATRTRLQVELAWHLRQRDGARANGLIERSRERLEDPRLAADLRASLTARLALAACEIDTLNWRIREAEAWLVCARAQLGTATDPNIEGDAWMAEATLAKVSGERERELRTLDAALSFFRASPDLQRAGVALGRALSDRSTSGSLPQAQDPWPDGGPAVEAWRLMVRAFDLWHREPPEAARLLMRAADLARGMGMLRMGTISLQNAGNAWLDLGDIDKAALCFSDGVRMAGPTGWPALVAAAKMPVGSLLRRLGRPRDSERTLNEALALLRAGPPSVTRAIVCAELALTLIDLDQDRQAADVLGEVVSFYRGIPFHSNVAHTLIRQIGPLARIGHTQQALAALDEAGALVAQHGLHALGIELLEAQAELHRHGRKLQAPASMSAPNPVIHFGQAALEQGRSVPGWKPPARLLTRMADAWAEAGDMAQAYAFEREARLAQEQDEFLKTGNPRALLHLLSLGVNPPEALAAFEPPAETHAATPAAQPLTAREQDILQLLARSYSNKEIAQALGVGVETVKWHLKSLFGKLGAASRRHAVTRGRGLGLVGAEA